MLLKPSEFPGSHERHLLRKADNPLFAEQAVVLDDAALLEAQRQDHELLLAYLQEFRQLLGETTSLADNVESDTILTLKDRLDRAYETASAVADDQQQSRAAIRKLLQLIMAAVRRGAGEDAQAQQELDQEDEARAAHFELLDSQLVADLLNPGSVITARELVPTLLSSAKEDLLPALQLFDLPQLRLLHQQGQALLASVQQQEGQGFDEEMCKLVFMEGYIRFLEQNLHLSD